MLLIFEHNKYKQYVYKKDKVNQKIEGGNLSGSKPQIFIYKILEKDNAAVPMKMYLLNTMLFLEI